MSTVTQSKEGLEEIPKIKPQITEEPKEMYSLLEDSIKKYYNEVKANAVNYLQAVSDLQQEVIELRKKNLDSAISLQKTISDKMGTSIKIPETGLEFAKSYFSQTAKTWELQNKIILASIDSLSKNIHAFNENTQTFADISSKLIKSWEPAIKSKTRE